MQEKIAKKIASTRLYSRRQVEQLIKQNKIKVNNIIITTPNALVQPHDVIKVNEKVIKISNLIPRLWLFNKPRGLLTTKADPKNRATIYTFLPRELQNSLYVGRLDFNSEGLLLLTNNGELVNYLTSAKNNIERVYKVKTFGKITQEQLNSLYKGIKINGLHYRSIKAKIISQNNLQTWIQFTLLEGKNNEIRKICKHFRLTVSRLVRVNFGPFALNKLMKGALQEVSTQKLKKLFPFLFDNS